MKIQPPNGAGSGPLMLSTTSTSLPPDLPSSTIMVTETSIHPDASSSSSPTSSSSSLHGLDPPTVLTTSPFPITRSPILRSTSISHLLTPDTTSPHDNLQNISPMSSLDLMATSKSAIDISSTSCPNIDTHLHTNAVKDHVNGTPLPQRHVPDLSMAQLKRQSSFIHNKVNKCQLTAPSSGSIRVFCPKYSYDPSLIYHRDTHMKRLFGEERVSVMNGELFQFYMIIPYSEKQSYHWFPFTGDVHNEISPPSIIGDTIEMCKFDVIMNVHYASTNSSQESQNNDPELSSVSTTPEVFPEPEDLPSQISAKNSPHSMTTSNTEPDLNHSSPSQSSKPPWARFASRFQKFQAFRNSLSLSPTPTTSSIFQHANGHVASETHSPVKVEERPDNSNLFGNKILVPPPSDIRLDTTSAWLHTSSLSVISLPIIPQDTIKIKNSAVVFALTNGDIVVAVQTLLSLKLLADESFTSIWMEVEIKPPPPSYYKELHNVIQRIPGTSSYSVTSPDSLRAFIERNRQLNVPLQSPSAASLLSLCTPLNVSARSELCNDNIFIQLTIENNHPTLAITLHDIQLLLSHSFLKTSSSVTSNSVNSADVFSQLLSSLFHVSVDVDELPLTLQSGEIQHTIIFIQPNMENSRDNITEIYAELEKYFLDLFSQRSTQSEATIQTKSVLPETSSTSNDLSNAYSASHITSPLTTSWSCELFAVPILTRHLVSWTLPSLLPLNYKAPPPMTSSNSSSSDADLALPIELFSLPSLSFHHSSPVPVHKTFPIFITLTNPFDWPATFTLLVEQPSDTLGSTPAPFAQQDSAGPRATENLKSESNDKISETPLDLPATTPPASPPSGYPFPFHNAVENRKLFRCPSNPSPNSPDVINKHIADPLSPTSTSNPRRMSVGYSFGQPSLLCLETSVFIGQLQPRESKHISLHFLALREGLLALNFIQLYIHELKRTYQCIEHPLLSSAQHALQSV